MCHLSHYPSISGPVAPSDTGGPAEDRIAGGGDGFFLPLEMVTGLEAHQNGYDICIYIYIYIVTSIFMGLYMYIHKYILRRSD